MLLDSKHAISVQMPRFYRRDERLYCKSDLLFSGGRWKRTSFSDLQASETATNTHTHTHTHTPTHIHVHVDIYDIIKNFDRITF